MKSGLVSKGKVCYYQGNPILFGEKYTKIPAFLIRPFYPAFYDQIFHNPENNFGMYLLPEFLKAAIMKSHECAKYLRICANFQIMNAKQEIWQ